jgi:hypothetical protein
MNTARTGGEAYRAAVQAMADRSGVQTRESDDFLIGVIVEPAEGMYEPSPGGHGLEWHEPEDANAHLEVAVADRHDGRFVPGLDVQVEVRASKAVVVVDEELPFLWHPFLYHYGANVMVPEAGDYTVTVRIGQPDFHRHDPVNGRRYLDPVEVTFDRIHFEPGVKPRQDGGQAPTGLPISHS